MTVRTNDHQTTVVPHDHVSCHTAKHAEGGDCGTRYEAHCSCGWAQGASTRAAADAIAVGHRSYSPDAPIIVGSNIPQGEITDDQLRDLFERHCECRPLDLARGEDDHAANHDCDTAILHDVQIALGIFPIADVDRFAGRAFEAWRAARARCAEYLALVPNEHGGYSPRKSESP